MKFTGYKNVQLSSLRFDIPDIKKRSKAAHVAELAASIRESGEDLIHAPTVRVESRELVCGRDRIAALIMLKLKKLWVHLVDCTDAEAKELERLENVHRRVDNRAQLLAELVEIREEKIRDAATATGDTVPSARSVTAAARKQVARAAGVKPASVKKAQQRAARKASAPPKGAETSSPVPGMGTSGSAAGAAQGEDVQPPTLDLLGCDDASAEAVAKFARKDQEAIDEADQALRRAQAALRTMTTCTEYQQLHAQVHRVASLVRSARPAFICPWCKGLPKSNVPACEPCGGRGYVSHEVAGRSPAELRNEGAPMVAIDGKFYPYADVRDGKAKLGKNGKPAKSGKTISVVKVDGSEADLEADEAY